MGMLPARHYESEHPRFVRELIDRKPHLPDEQKTSRAIWWDKSPRDLAERRVMDLGRLAQKAYSYFSWK